LKNGPCDEVGIGGAFLARLGVGRRIDSRCFSPLEPQLYYQEIKRGKTFLAKLWGGQTSFFHQSASIEELQTLVY
jgi:hypothetical protein